MQNLFCCEVVVDHQPLFIVFGTSSRLKAALQSDRQIPWEGGFALLVIDEVVSSYKWPYIW